MKIKRSNFFASMVIDLLVFVVLTVVAVVLVSTGIIGYFTSYNTEFFVNPFADFENEFYLLDFDSIDIEKSLGKGSHFYVFKDGELNYQSNSMTFPLTKEQADLIPYDVTGADISHTVLEDPEYGEIHVIEYLDEDSKTEFLAVVSLEEVVYASIELPEKLPEGGLDILLGDYDTYHIFKDHYMVNNANYEVIFFNYRNRETSAFNEIITQLLFVLLGLATVVLIFTILYLIRLNRKVNKPLVLLKEALDEFDMTEHRIDYKGPKEFMEICDRFNQMAKRLHETQSEKQQIISGLSHDIRTPLTVIQTYTQALHDGIVPKEELEEYLEVIKNKSKEMNELVTLLNDYSKLFNTQFELSREKVDLNIYLQNYVDKIESDINEGGFDLQVNVEKELSVFIDHFQFKRVLDNIIQNALKYNNPGVTIYIRAYMDGENTCLSIANDGQKIDEEIKNDIFHAFVTNDQARISGQGTGLGLSIVKKIVEMHEGTIEFTDKKYAVEFIISLKQNNV